MIQKIKNRILLTFSAVAMLLPVAVPVTVGAVDVISGGLCQGAENFQVTSTGGGVCTDSGINQSNANATLIKIINIISAIVGVIAVIMIIYGGFKYITSGGDTARVGSAKTTILYALIGLVIVALAQIIVRFVISTTQDVTS